MVEDVLSMSEALGLTPDQKKPNLSIFDKSKINHLEGKVKQNFQLQKLVGIISLNTKVTDDKYLK